LFYKLQYSINACCKKVAQKIVGLPCYAKPNDCVIIQTIIIKVSVAA